MDGNDLSRARRLMTMAEVEAEFGFAINTLRFWRYRGTGPRSFRLGRRVVYARTDVEQWINKARTGNTGAA